jgi:hypothetical protein
VVPAFVTELCFRTPGCEEIAAPPEVGISGDFFVSPDFRVSGDRLKGRAGKNPLDAARHQKIHYYLYLRMLGTSKLR